MSSDRRTVVLAAVDGSVETADGVVVATQLARAWGVDLHVVHVWSGIPPVSSRAVQRRL